MNKRKLKRSIGKLMKERINLMPKQISKGLWGTRSLKNRMHKGKAVAFLQVIDMKSNIVQLVMPVAFFEESMKRAGFTRQEQPEGVQAMSQNVIPDNVRELAMPMPVAA